MKTIDCIGLINSNGVKFVAPVRFECELSDGKSYIRVKGKKIYQKPEYFIKNQMFETVKADGAKDFWYDNDKNMIVSVSKFGKKQWNELQKSVI